MKILITVDKGLVESVCSTAPKSITEVYVVDRDDDSDELVLVSTRDIEAITEAQSQELKDLDARDRWADA